MSNAWTGSGRMYEGVASVRVRAAVDAGDDVDARAIDVGVTVGVAVRAELFDEVDTATWRPSPEVETRTSPGARGDGVVGLAHGGAVEGRQQRCRTGPPSTRSAVRGSSRESR
jgi:hypothetical protein